MEIIGYENSREKLHPKAIEYFKSQERDFGNITIIWGNGGVLTRPKGIEGIVIIDWGVPVGPINPKHKMLFYTKPRYPFPGGYNLTNDFFLSPHPGLETFERDTAQYLYRYIPEPYEHGPTAYCQVARNTIWTLCSLSNFHRADVLNSLFYTPLIDCRVSAQSIPTELGKSTKKAKRENLIAAVTAAMGKTTKSLEEQISTKIEAAQRRTREAAAAYNQAHDLELQLKAAQSRESVLRSRAIKVINEIDNHSALKDITFNSTTKQLVCHTNLIYLYKRDRRTRVPLGEFDISLDMSTFAVGIRNRTNAKEQPYREGRVLHHPHVPGISGSFNTPCWGDAYTVISRYLRDGDIAGFFNYTIKFLESYQYDHRCPWFDDEAKFETKRTVDGKSIWMTSKEYSKYQADKRKPKSVSKPASTKRKTATRTATSRRVKTGNETRRIRESRRRVQAK